MTQEQFEKRNGKAETEPLVISKNDDGFRVFSASDPGTTYYVTGVPESPVCNCPDFRFHNGDPDWQCKHILAVLSRMQASGKTTGPNDPYADEERRAIQEEGRKPEESRVTVKPNGHAQMLLKRSVSPDGRIDSLSVEFTCPVEKASVQEIKSRARQTLSLQSEIVESFLSGNKKGGGNGNGSAVPDAEPGRLLDIGGMDGKWGRRLFINVQVNGHSVKLFGSPKHLADALAAAGFPGFAEHIAEGLELNLPCRVVTKPSPDGRFLNVEQVLPQAALRQERRAR